MRDCYPSYYVIDEDHWRRRIAAYWEAVKKYHPITIERACELAPTEDHHPKKYPSAGELALICRRVQRELTEAGAIQAPKRHTHSPGGQPRKLDPDSPWERLIERWEQGGQRPDESLEDFHLRRIRELKLIWNNSHGVDLDPRRAG